LKKKVVYFYFSISQNTMNRFGSLQEPMNQKQTTAKRKSIRFDWSKKFNSFRFWTISVDNKNLNTTVKKQELKKKIICLKT